MRLTLQEGRGFIPVAKIDSADHLNREVLFVDPSLDSPAEPDPDVSLQDIDYSKYMGKMKPREAAVAQNTLAKHLTRNLPPLDSSMAKSFQAIRHDLARTFRLKSGSFVPLPDINKERVIYYVFGPSGSGKSCFTASLLRQWLKLNPGKDVYVFSKLDDDQVIDDLGSRVKRIDIGTLRTSPLDVSELPQGSMVVFDDCDCVEDKAVHDAILKLENSIYQVGRHHRLSVIKTSHLGSDYKNTRVVLTEAHYLVVYPSSGSFQQIKYILSHYMGLSNAEIQRIRSLKSRWVVLSKHFPQYVLSENECYLLGEE